ncbi:MAG: hypothetical protein ACLQVL_29695 [Terriglobia bacterium]
MDVQEKLSPVISAAQEHNLVPRLPRTFQPYINQEIQRWPFKFPYERTYLERVIGYLDGLSPDQFAALFQGVLQVEAKMELNSHSFSAQEQTIEGAAVLARSPYYLAWREEVNKVFDRIHASALAEEQARMAAVARLLLLVFPKDLPLDPHALAGNWPEAQVKKLDWEAGAGAGASLLEAVLRGRPQPDGKRGAGFLEEFAARTERALGDVWLIESGTALRDLLPGLETGSEGSARAILLSFERLQAFREGFLDQIKSMRKALADADRIMDRLRAVDVTRWCPAEIKGSPVIREFVRSLFLSSNGSQLFSNAFLEWGTTQAVAHARPVVVLGEFGLRMKPKPFTSVAIFEDPATANPMPSVPDPEGSAVDAGMLAYYTWLEMRRYPECRRTACVCLFENAPHILVAGAEDFALWKEAEPISPDRLASVLRSWLG